jgi:hypothetical protein
MTGSLTDWLQESRLVVVEVDHERGRLRVKGAACSDLACQTHTVVITEDGRLAGVDALYPGDVVRLESDESDDGLIVTKVVVLRRVWEQIASPEI